MSRNEPYDEGPRRTSLCTHSGREFMVLEPRAGDVAIEDIAWSTGMKCRYTGHTNRFYSVAEHCLLVEQYVSLRWPLDLDLRREGLLHDGSEAYLPDMTGPVKRDPRVHEWYHPIETRVDEVVAEAFGLPYPASKEVKIADKELFKAEVLQLMPSVYWWNIEEPDEYASVLHIQGLDPALATRRFMESYRRLFL